MWLMRWRNRSFAEIKYNTFIIICRIDSKNKQLGKHILDNKIRVKIFGEGFFQGREK